MSDLSKTNTGLVQHARQWVGQPYWYGTCCYPCTQALLTRKAQQYPTYYTAGRMPRYQKDIAAGRGCADCVGLIKGYWWENNGIVTYDAKTDVSATGLLNASNRKGVIGTLPEVPGLVVYKVGHVGIYEGNGSVVEAKGFDYGVIRSVISQTAWTHWLVSPNISYAGYESLLLPDTAGMPYTAKVTTSKSPLNIWTDSSKKKSLLKVAKGDTLTVLAPADPIGWYTVEKNGVQGVADGQYLQKVLS